MFRLIASYPKSGNTYVRVFLSHYLRGETDLNRLGFPLFSSIAFFPIGMPRPRHSLRGPERDIYVKTHETPNFFGRGHVDRALYLVRHPYDVCPSFARHMGINHDKAVEGLANLKNSLVGTDKIYPQFISSWSRNVSMWLGNDRFPTLFIRYETLAAYPDYGFREILNFFGFPVVEEKFQASLEFVRIENLQAKENDMKEGGEKTQFREARGSTGKFFNVGRAGNGREVLTPEQMQRIYKTHGKIMDLLHYENA